MRMLIRTCGFTVSDKQNVQKTAVRASPHYHLNRRHGDRGTSMLIIFPQNFKRCVQTGHWTRGNRVSGMSCTGWVKNWPTRTIFQHMLGHHLTPELLEMEYRLPLRLRLTVIPCLEWRRTQSWCPSSAAPRSLPSVIFSGTQPCPRQITERSHHHRMKVPGPLRSCNGSTATAPGHSLSAFHTDSIFIQVTRVNSRSGFAIDEAL